MGVTTTQTNKPFSPRGNDQSPLAFNRAKLFSGKALDFDGVNDNIVASSFSELSGEAKASVSLYMNFDSINSSENWLIGQDTTSDRVFAFGYKGSTNEIRLQVNGTNTSGLDTFVLTAGEWYHYLFTFDTTTNAVVIYVNGQQVATGTQTKDFITATSDLYIGQREYPSAEGRINGKIANVKIFNEVLTAAQVADLYNNPEKVVPTGVDNTALKLWLPMQEGAGTTAYDGSGNGNHGTISGATYTHGIGAPVSQTAVIDWNKSSNYIDKSEEFETASWSENRLVTITDDSFIAPDGSATATEIVETTANDSHFLAQTLSVTAGDYFISAYVKKRDYDWVQLSTGGDTSRYANFNISTGATGNASGISDLVIQDKGNGWYRIGGKLTTSATSFNYFITLIQSDVASRFQTYTGTDKGQYIWGAQATKSATLQPYLRNIGTSAVTADVLLPQGLTTGRDITGVNLFENVRKQGALNLDGNSWAEVHDNESLDITDAVSVECWVNVTDGSANKMLISKWSPYADDQRSYLLYLTDGEYLRFSISSDGQNSHTVSSSQRHFGAWKHFVATYDKTTLRLYVNGAAENTAAQTAAINVGTFQVEIGRHQGDTSAISSDSIAQPRIYNRALTAEEVQRNYNAGKNTYSN